ncbi:MAG: MBL fold metallo-hydrolase, partial [Oscillospiraceae bacterium]|nr:MBL fold metallo-hydrolase [Oscillospiraceae bacterium]
MMRRQFRPVLHILFFFLVMAALFVVRSQDSVAYAADRMYTFNMGFDGMQGNLILVESNGRWGLMDGGHRNANTIQDSNGRVISVPQSEQYSNQISMRNGKDVAQYMVNVLGVTHLDFIVGTHSHMDHIGGIPEISTTGFYDAAGNYHYLVDGNTTYFYKEYQHIADLEDDLAQYSDLSWHNQAYYYQATKTMQNQGANMVDVSKQQVIHGDPGNAYGDYITFTMGNMSFRLYNVYEQTNTNNENVNSIVTVMTNGNYTVVNLSDINTNNGAIDRTSEAISKDFGAVDVVVAGHHGYAGSNTKIMFDELQPHYVVISNDSAQNSWLYTDCDLAAAIPYAQRLFGTLFYSTALSPYAIVTDLSGNQVYVYNLESNGALTDAFFKIIKSTKKTGWVSWINTNETLWAYLQDGKPLTDTWKELNKKWYHFGSDGLMQTGFIGDEGGVRFCDSNGAMVIGWQMIDGRWCYFVPGIGYRATNTWWEIDKKRYYFDENGYLRTGYVGDEGGVRFCDSTGAMVTGWRFLNDRWCYFVPGIGYRATNTWWEIDGERYCFDENGYLRTGFIGDEGGVRFCDSTGAMVTGWRFLNDRWCYFVPGIG